MIGNIVVGTLNTQTVKPVVTGGTLVSDSTYYYRYITGTDTLSVTNNSLTADVLILAGGGGGGQPTSGASFAGGGGGGGLVLQVGTSLSGS